MLLIWCEGLSINWRGTLHTPVITSLVPCNTIISSQVIAMVSWLKLDSHPASHNLSMDMRRIFSWPGKMWASLALLGIFDMTNRPTFVDFRIWPLTFFTLIGAVWRSAMLCGASDCKQFLYAYVSTMDDFYRDTWKEVIMSEDDLLVYNFLSP